MNPHETGYSAAVPNRPAVHLPTTASQASRSAASVVAVVVLVLFLSAPGVYATVFFDLMPQPQ
jgi:hypothetical protein